MCLSRPSPWGCSCIGNRRVEFGDCIIPSLLWQLMIRGSHLRSGLRRWPARQTDARQLVGLKMTAFKIFWCPLVRRPKRHTLGRYLWFDFGYVFVVVFICFLFVFLSFFIALYFYLFLFCIFITFFSIFLWLLFSFYSTYLLIDESLFFHYVPIRFSSFLRNYDHQQNHQKMECHFYFLTQLLLGSFIFLSDSCPYYSDFVTGFTAYFQLHFRGLISCYNYRHCYWIFYIIVVSIICNDKRPVSQNCATPDLFMHVHISAYINIHIHWNGCLLFYL